MTPDILYDIQAGDFQGSLKARAQLTLEKEEIG